MHISIKLTVLLKLGKLITVESLIDNSNDIFDMFCHLNPKF